MSEFSREAARKAAQSAIETAANLGRAAKDALGNLMEEAPRQKRAMMLGAGLAMAGMVGIERMRVVEAEQAIESHLLIGEGAEKVVHQDAWEARSTSAIRLEVRDQKKKTVYHLLKGVMEKDPVYQHASEQDRADMIDAAIALTRTMNPEVDLDHFSELVGKEVVFPVGFEWTGSGEVYDKDHGGYGLLQKAAENDGFPVRKGSQQEIFDRAVRTAGDVPLKGTGFVLDREGSEDSLPKLEPDVVASIQDLGAEFFAFNPTTGESGWSFTGTDLMRGPAAQKTRESIKESTHPTGRSFDISDGQWWTPDGKRITWSITDPSTNKKVKGPDADFIDEELRPAFVHLATKRGWLLYKEPGHWHVYVPKEPHVLEPLRVDLTEEWATYLTIPDKKESVAPPMSLEHIPDVSRRISEKFLADAAAMETQRLTRNELFEKRNLLEQDLQAFFEEFGEKIDRPFLTALMRFPLKEGVTASMSAPSDPETRKAWLKARVIDLVRSASPEDLGDTELLKGMTVHGTSRPPFSDLVEIWAWKRDKHVAPEYKRFVEYVAARVAPLEHEMTFTTWYRRQTEIQALVLQHAEELGFTRELVAYTTPEVVVALTHAEFASELGGDTYRELIPAIFSGYNMLYGPAAGDREMSSGPAQLITGTFLGRGGILQRHGAETRALVNTDPSFANIIVPVKDTSRMYSSKEIKESTDFSTKEVSEAMVLSADSAIYWSYLSALYHADAAFAPLMGSGDFRRLWEEASEEDRLLFIGSLTPLANNGGRKRAADAAVYTLDHVKGKTLVQLAEDLRNSVSHPNAKRGAVVGFASMKAMFDWVEE